MKKRGTSRINFIIILAIILIVFAIGLSYFTFFYLKEAESQEEFNTALYNCNRVSYISDDDSAIWKYEIKGKEEENCLVNVKLVSVKTGSADLEKLEGNEMVCEIVLGVVTNPTSNLKNCHGLLKEEMQNMLLEKMHAYLTSNLEEISSEFNST